MRAVLAARQLLHKRHWHCCSSSCGLLRTSAVSRGGSLATTPSSVTGDSCVLPEDVADDVMTRGAQLLGTPASTTVRRSCSLHSLSQHPYSSTLIAGATGISGRTSSIAQHTLPRAGGCAAQPDRLRALSTERGSTQPSDADAAAANTAAKQLFTPVPQLVSVPVLSQHLMTGVQQNPTHPQQQQLQMLQLPEEVLMIGIDPDTQGAVAVVRARLRWCFSTPQDASSSSSSTSITTAAAVAANHPGVESAGAPAASRPRSRRRSTKSSGIDSNASNSDSSSSSTAEVPQLQAYMDLPPAAVCVYDMPVEITETHSKTSTGRARKRRRLDILQAMALIRQVLQDTAETAGTETPTATPLPDSHQQGTPGCITSSSSSSSSDTCTMNHSSSSDGATASVTSSIGSAGDTHAGSDNSPASLAYAADCSSSSSSTGSTSRHGRILLRAVLEVAPIRPANGSLATLNTGFSCGAWTALLSSHGFDVTSIHVRRWKKDMGLLRQNKDSSRQLARQVFDRAGASQDALLRTKNTHGRAEALLLAAWGLGWSVDSQGEHEASLTQGPLPAIVHMDTGMHVLPVQQQHHLAAQQDLLQQQQQQQVPKRQTDPGELVPQQSRGAADDGAAASPPADTAAAVDTSSDSDDADDAADAAGSGDESDIEGLLCGSGSSGSNRGAATLLGVPYSLLAPQQHPLWGLTQQQQPRLLDVGAQIAADAAAAEAKVAAKQAEKEQKAADRAAAAAKRAAAKEEAKQQQQAARAAAAQERAAKKAQAAADKAAAAEKKAQAKTAKATAAAEKTHTPESARTKGSSSSSSGGRRKRRETLT